MSTWTKYIVSTWWFVRQFFKKKTFVEQIASRYSFRKPLDSVRCCLVVRETSVRYKSLFRRLNSNSADTWHCTFYNTNDLLWQVKVGWDFLFTVVSLWGVWLVSLMQHYASFYYRAMLCISRTMLSQNVPSVRPPVCPSVCPSGARRYSVETAKHIITFFHRQ